MPEPTSLDGGAYAARELIVTRGLPASGKTTKALAWVAGDPQHRARVGRDVLREHIYGVLPLLPAAGEAELTRLQEQIIRELLLRRSVVVDDTNLPEQRITEWARVARRHRARLVVWDLRDIPLEVCIARDAARGAAGGRQVGEHVIRQIAARGTAGWEVGSS